MNKFYNYRIAQLDSQYSKGLNYLKRNHAAQVNYDAFDQDAAEIEGVLADFAAEAERISNDPKLSGVGKQDELATLQERTIDRLATINKTDTLENGLVNIQNQLLSAELSFFKDNGSADETLSYFQEEEMRRYAFRLRDEKKAEHEAWLQKQQEAGHPVSDQERQFKDPVESLWQEACQAPTPDKAQLLRAFSRAPWPVSVLPQEVIEAGKQELRKALTPEAAEQMKRAQLRQGAYGLLFDGACEIIKKPESARLKKH